MGEVRDNLSLFADDKTVVDCKIWMIKIEKLKIVRYNSNIMNYIPPCIVKFFCYKAM